MNNVKTILDNTTKKSKSKDVCVLGTNKDIRYIKFSNNGILYGVGGNQSYSELDDNIFMFEPYRCESIKTQKAVEVKYFTMDERREELYYADFQKKNLVKLSMKDLSIIKEADIYGISPQMVSDENSDYIFLIYDQPLWIEKRRKSDLMAELRLDVLRSDVCGFGSIGISLSLGGGHSLFASFMNCKRGIIEIDISNLYPVKLLEPEDKINWYIATSHINNSLYVAYPSRNYISEYDLKSLTLKRHINAGFGIRFILESYDGKLLYAADYLTGKIYIIDIIGNKILNIYQFGRKTYAIAEHPFTHNIFVGGPAGIWEIEFEGDNEKQKH
ncbi:MAG: YncE family protein [Myxococcota bacterium]